MNNSLISIPLHAFIFQTVNHRIEQTWSVPTLGMDRFTFLKNDRYVLKTMKKNEKQNDRFLKNIVLKNGRFQNDSFSF